jgi:hypothetical protein
VSRSTRSRRRTLTRSIGGIGVIGRRYSIRMHPMPPMVPMQFSVEEQIRFRPNSQPPRSPLWSLCQRKIASLQGSHMSAIEALRAARDLGVELTVAQRGGYSPR